MYKFLRIFFPFFLLSISVISQEIVKLPASINSDDIEFAPTVSGDGKTLIFQSNRNGTYLLYETFRISKFEWSEPVPIIQINNALSTTDLAASPFISYDGNTLYLMISHGPFSADIYYSNKINNKWNLPQKLDNAINTEEYEAFLSTTKTQDKIYFIRQSNKNIKLNIQGNKKFSSFMCTDIYFSYYENNQWTIPEMLPLPINQLCEKYPQITPDGNGIFFGSNRHTESDKFNLFFSSYTRGEWSLPIKIDLGEAIPLIGVDYTNSLIYFSDGNDLFYTNIPESIVHLLSNQEKEDIEEGISITYPALKENKYLHWTENSLPIEAQISLKEKIVVSLVNGREVKISENGKLSTYVDLAPGENEIEIKVIDQQQRVHKETFIVNAILKEASNHKPDEKKGTITARKDRALLIATDEYNEWKDLNNPIYDANAIARELKENYNYEVEILYNPTNEELFKKLRDYAQKDYSPDDQLLIFVAGHGHFDEVYGEGFIVTKDSKIEDEARVSYVSHNRLRAIINNIQCDHIFLTIDACFGGTFDQKISMNSSSRGGIYNEINRNEFIYRKLKYKTRLFLTSGGKEYVSDGLPNQHSPFTRKFLEALRGLGGEDHVLTYQELLNYVGKITPEPRTGEFGSNEPGSDFLFIKN